MEALCWAIWAVCVVLGFCAMVWWMVWVFTGDFK